MKRIILGSQSPRRKEILSQFSIPFDQATPPFVEESVSFQGDPVDYAITLSRGKGDSLCRLYPQAIILTADTVVYCAGRIYNKPQSFDEAVSFLSTFSGNWHSVFTAVTIREGQVEHSACEMTNVLFNDLNLEQIHRFLHSIAWQDKGGGYTIQGIGSLVVRKIEGCYYNVTGLPVNTVRKLFLKVGIDLWNYIPRS